VENRLGEMRKISQIPIRSLNQRGKSNFEINRLTPGSAGLYIYPPDIEHRDDYYIFIYQKTGNSTIIVDFQDNTLSGNSVLCIQPGQIHFGNFSQDTDAWIISVTSEWVPSEIRLSLMENTAANRPVDIQSDTDRLSFNDTLQLLQKFEEQDIPSEKIVQSIFNVCLNLFMQAFHQAIDGREQRNLRPTLITRQFRSLLLSNFRVMKSPAEYATSLTITPVYLNEVVKGTTGYPVSYWIHQEIILEAKRTLFYTNNTVKEIAHALGYVDPAYFIRLFKKVTGTSPQQFRQKYRK
jgi:AraC family transcriptional regulator, transcriptional activator of pobA